MHDFAGLIALAVIGLWIAYLVPHRLRYRQQLLESRTEDRFSAALRVLVVTGARRPERRAPLARAECGPDGVMRPGLLSPARGVPVRVGTAVTDGRGGVVERPYGTQDRITAEDARRAAQVRARRAAAVARRAAAARRRGVLTGVLLVASVLAWAVVGLTSVSVVAAVVPTLMLAGVIGLGRRAVVSARRADAAWERQQQRLSGPVYTPAPRVTGRALRPSDSHTESIAQVGGGAVTGGSGERTVTPTAPTARAGDAPSSTTDTTTATPQVPGSAADAPAEDAGDDPAPAGTDVPAPADADAAPAGPGGEPSAEGWSPVPVPRPTYTTKAPAPRREPLPLVVDAPVAPAADLPGAEVPAAGAGPAVPPVDLDAILARRRAAGE